MATKKWRREEEIEYIQICEFCRHDDVIAYQAGSIFIPISFAILPIANQYPEISIPLAIFSISINLYWVLICDRMAFFSQVRKKRAAVLEKRAGLQLITQNINPPEDTKRKWGRKISIRKVRWFFLLLLVFSWIIMFYLKGIFPFSLLGR